MKRYLSMALALLCLVGVSLHAAETGVLESREGFVDPDSGARVESVGQDDQGEYRVLVSVPREGEDPPAVIEEVVVTAKAIDAPVKVKPRFELVNDYANDRYGYYIYLGPHRELPFRIYFKDHTSDDILNR